MTILNSSQFGNLVRDGGGGRPGILTPGFERQSEPTLGRLVLPQLEIWRLGLFNLGAEPDSPLAPAPRLQDRADGGALGLSQTKFSFSLALRRGEDHWAMLAFINDPNPGLKQGPEDQES